MGTFMRWRTVGAVATATALLVGSVGLAPAATADSAAAVSVSFKARYATVNKGKTEVFTYAASGLPSGASGKVQRLSGSSWVTTATVGSRASGSVSVAVHATTKWRLVYDKSSKRVGSSTNVEVKVIPPATATLKAGTVHVATGKAPTFTYTARNIASGVTVVLQRTSGTSQAWTNVKTVKAAGQDTALTAAALNTLGRYKYRLVVKRGTAILTATGPVTAYAYAKVALNPYGNSGGTVQVADKLFEYNDWEEGSTYPSYKQHSAFDGHKLSCRSLTVQFAGSKTAQEYDRTSYLEFVQTTKDPVYASAPAGVVGSVTVKLDGGPLYINLSSSGSGASLDILQRVTGSCWTVSGTL